MKLHVDRGEKHLTLTERVRRDVYQEAERTGKPVADITVWLSRDEIVTLIAEYVEAVLGKEPKPRTDREVALIREAKASVKSLNPESFFKHRRLYGARIDQTRIIEV